MSLTSSSKFSPLVVGIGELLWDLLPGGRQLGGAPANFAFHAHNLGARVEIVSRVGNDALGQEILTRFKAIGLPIDGIQLDSDVPTGTVEVNLDGNGMPQYLIRDNVAWDRVSVEQPTLATVRQCDAICFGSLAQRDPVARKSIQELVAAAPAESLRIFDVNLRQDFYTKKLIESSLQLSNILKLNETELPVLAKMFHLKDSVREAIEKLAGLFKLRAVALTCGERGSLIYHDGHWSEQNPRPTDVVDTVGAGDSFTAAMAMGMLAKMSLEELHGFASEVARFVCSQPGAMPALPARFREKILFGGSKK